MKLRNRFLLVGIGMILFLAVTPVLVLYARGFKYDFQAKKIVKTGTLVVKSKPVGAEIFLDDKKQKTHTPASLRFLLPKDYIVRVEKDGYQSWTKRLGVKEQLVTWANLDREFITLFLANPRPVWQTPNAYASLSKDRSQVIFLKDGGWRIIQTGSEREAELGALASDAANFTLPLIWSDPQQMVRFINQTKLPLTAAQLADISKIEANDTSLVFIQDGNLMLYRDNNLVVLEQSVLDFTLDGDTVWFINQTNIRRRLVTEATSVLVAGIPPTQSASIIRPDNQLYVVLDDQLYQVNDELEYLYSPVKFAKWNAGSGLLLGNENEILVYWPNQKKLELVMRSVTPIQQAILNQTTGYIFYANENRIKAVELDGRDHRNIFTITPLNEKFRDFTVADDGELLYLINESQIEILQIR